MSRSYQEIMENIQITDEMKKRIISGVQEKMTEKETAGDSEIQPSENNPAESLPENVENKEAEKHRGTGNPKIPEKQGTTKNRTGRLLQFMKKKKILSAAACLALLLLAASAVPGLIPRGSSSSASSSSAESADLAVESNSLTVNEGTDSDASGGIDIAYYASADDLSNAAGFEVSDLDPIPFDTTDISYAWEWNEFAQITYTGEQNTLTYRKAVGEDDISGDYNEFEEVSGLNLDGTQVTLKGSGGTCRLAVWTRDGYTYSISLESGIDPAEMESLVKSAR